jgi:Cys-tRNA(Pro) deacylase
MTLTLPKSARKIQQAIEQQGFDFQVIELPESTRSAQEAANAIGCDLGQIVKSLVFKEKNTEIGVIVLASGVNQVDAAKLMAYGSGELDMATASFVKQHTGFTIGGVPPFGHTSDMQTYIDQDLLQYDFVWAAAGTPHTVFQLDPAILVAVTQGILCEIRTD